MKKLLLLISFACFAPVLLFSQDTLIGWSFPTGTKSDSLANMGLGVNKTQAIHLKSDSMIMYITKTYATPPACAQAMGLSDATAQEKGWYIQLSSAGYTNLKLYSKQMACPMHSGPKYWKIQYKSGTGSWNDVPNGNITCALNWITGVKSNLALPTACNDNSSLFIRWITVNDTNVPGASHGTELVTDSSMSRIDDIMILAEKIIPGYDTIVGWTFPTATLADTVANFGIPANDNSVIKLKSAMPVTILTKTYASPPACAQAMGMSSATAEEKGWYIDFSTAGYEDLLIYSKQMACPMHSGPKYWKVQYKVTGGSWMDVPGANITNALNWIKGIMSGIALPAACEDASMVSLRWITVNDTNVSGASSGTVLVTDTSMTRIDDIFVLGKVKTSINNTVNSGYKIYPVPSEGLIRVDCREKPQSIMIYNSVGVLVYENTSPGMNNIIDLGSSGKGVYIIRIKTTETTRTSRLIIK